MSENWLQRLAVWILNHIGTRSIMRNGWDLPGGRFVGALQVRRLNPWPFVRMKTHNRIVADRIREARAWGRDDARREVNAKVVAAALRGTASEIDRLSPTELLAMGTIFNAEREDETP